jgi:hypothetical protein
MNRHRNWIVVATSLLFAVSLTTAQDEKDSRSNVFVQMEVLDMNNGLPGARSWSVAPVGGRFGKETSTERDSAGKLLYSRTFDGQSRWLQDNVIEIRLEITENGAKRTETIQLKNFEPKILVLRENKARGWCELLRLMPVFDPRPSPAQAAN